MSGTLRHLVKEFGRVSEFGWIIKKHLGNSYFGSQLFSDIIRETSFAIKNPSKTRRAFSCPKVESRADLGEHLWGQTKKEKMNQEMVLMPRSEREQGTELQIGQENRTSIQGKGLEIASVGLDDDDDEEEELDENEATDNETKKDEKNNTEVKNKEKNLKEEKKGML